MPDENNEVPNRLGKKTDADLSLAADACQHFSHEISFISPVTNSLLALPRGRMKTRTAIWLNVEENHRRVPSGGLTIVGCCQEELEDEVEFQASEFSKLAHQVRTPWAAGDGSRRDWGPLTGTSAESTFSSACTSKKNSAEAIETIAAQSSARFQPKWVAT